MSGHSRRSPVEIIRAIIYARVSKDDGKRGRSVAEQEASCTADCEYEGWTIAAVLTDNDRGASRHSRRDREQFQTLPTILKRGDVLVVWEPSRITRDMKEFGAFCDLCAERGVLLYYDSRLWDLNDDDDRNRVWQDILDGAKQAGKTRKRVLRALDANLTDGKPHGKTPPGYRIRYEGGRAIGREVIPAQQAVLKTAARRVLNEGPSVSLRAVSKELAEQWKMAGGSGRFEPRDVRRFLISPTTFGYRAHDNQIARKGTWDPILDPEWYRPLCAILNDPGRLMHRGNEPMWLLTYLAKCGACLELGEPGVIGRKGLDERCKTETYTCRKYGHVRRNMKRVDDHVEELLLQLLEAPDALAKLTASEDEDQVSIDDELATIDRVRAEIKAYIKQAAKTRMSALAMSTYVEELESEIAEAQARIDAMTNAVDPVLRDIVGPHARRKWTAYTIPQRREVIRRAMTVTIQQVDRRGRFSDLGVSVEPVPQFMI
ncbi:recombinase family protein [Nocardia sp. NPDC059154]